MPPIPDGRFVFSAERGGCLMPVFGPLKRSDLIKYLRNCGFDGPYSGGKHRFMLKGDLTLTIPDPHLKDIGIELLKRILRQAGFSRKEWEKM